MAVGLPGGMVTNDELGEEVYAHLNVGHGLNDADGDQPHRRNRQG